MFQVKMLSRKGDIFADKKRLREDIMSGLVSLGRRVFVAPSMLGGRGLFARSDIRQGEIVCWFRGRAANLDPLKKSSSIDLLHKLFRYSYCVDGKCNIPLDFQGEQIKLPPHLSGHLINECSIKDGLHLRPNVYLDLIDNIDDPLTIKKSTCPFYGTNYFEWPIVASRNISKYQEFLLCYGEGYSFRTYDISKHCCSTCL